MTPVTFTPVKASERVDDAEELLAVARPLHVAQRAAAAIADACFGDLVVAHGVVGSMPSRRTTPSTASSGVDPTSASRLTTLPQPASATAATEEFQPAHRYTGAVPNEIQHLVRPLRRQFARGRAIEF